MNPSRIELAVEAIVLATVLGSSQARAAEIAVAGNERPTIQFALDYEAPESCPAREQVGLAVTRRDARLELASAAAPPRRFRVVVHPTERGFSGELAQESQGTTRVVTGKECAKVADALALVLALALGSEQAKHEVLPEEIVLEESEPAPPSESKPAPVIASPTSKPPTAEADAGTSSSPPRAAAHKSDWGFAVGASGLWGAAPVALGGGELAIERAHDAGWLFVRLGAQLEYGLGEPRHRLLALTTGLGLRSSFGVWDLSVSGGLGFGSLLLSGASPEASSVWATPAVGPAARVHLSRHWWLELALSAGFPLVRQAVPVSGDSFTTEPVVVGLGLSGGIATPKKGG